MNRGTLSLIGAWMALSLAWVAPAGAQILPPQPGPDYELRAVRDSERLFYLDTYAQAAWYAADEGGSGWFFSGVDPAEGLKYLNITGFSYDIGGNPLWLLGSNPAPTFNRSIAIMWTDQPFATWEADLLDGRGGACPTCPFRPATVSPSSYGKVQLTWRSPSYAEVTVNGVRRTPIQPSDLLLGPSLYDRLQGQGFMAEQARFPGLPLQRLGCRIVLNPVARPSLEELWEVTPEVRIASIPPPDARWLRLDTLCGTSFAFPPAGGNYNRSPTYVAVPTRGDQPFAYVLTLREGDQGSAQPIKNAEGQVRGWRILGTTWVGRIYAVGPDRLIGYRSEAHDRNIVQFEHMYTRTQPVLN